MLWVDCEFTGLNMEEGHRIIEIGAVVTTLGLNAIDSYQSFMNYDWPEIEDLMAKNPWWDAHADDKPYMKAGLAAGKPVHEIDAELAAMTDAYFPLERPSLAGNSVGNDKRHIDVQLPDFASRLNYQIIDVSSLKILARKYRGIGYEGKSHQHHALEDVHESIDELRFLLTRLGIVDLKTLP
jgi:oligoribonuclease